MKTASGVPLEVRFEAAFMAAAVEMGVQAQTLLNTIRSPGNPEFPHLTGALQSSGQLESDDALAPGKDKYSMTLWFGDDSVRNKKTKTLTSEYAMAQHDPAHPDPTDWPYLPKRPFYVTKPLDRVRDSIVTAVRAAYHRGLRA